MGVGKKIFLIILVTVLTLSVILYYILKVDMPGNIYAQGMVSMWYLLISLLIAVTAIGIITYLFIDRLILSRLARLSDGVTHMVPGKKSRPPKIKVKLYHLENPPFNINHPLGWFAFIKESILGNRVVVPEANIRGHKLGTFLRRRCVP